MNWPARVFACALALCLRAVPFSDFKSNQNSKIPEFFASKSEIDASMGVT